MNAITMSAPRLSPVELQTRRSGLGLSQTEFAGLLGTTQVVVSRWETGLASPRDPDGVRALLSEYESRLLAVEDRLLARADELQPGAPVELRVPTREEYANTATAGALPHSTYRVCVARAAMVLRDEGRSVTIS